MSDADQGDRLVSNQISGVIATASKPAPSPALVRRTGTLVD